jgi:hypothetical protein
MMTPDRQTFASLHKLIPEEPWRFGMATLLSDGSVVRTSCPGVEGLNAPEIGYSVARMFAADPPGLLARHQEHVETFCRQRGAKVATTTFPELARREVALGEALLNASPNSHGSLFLTFFLMPAALALVILWLRAGGLRWVDLAYAGGIAAISMRLLRDFVVMPLLRTSILASHSPPVAAPDSNG